MKYTIFPETATLIQLIERYPLIGPNHPGYISDLKNVLPPSLSLSLPLYYRLLLQSTP